MGDKVLLRLFDLGIDAEEPPSHFQIALDVFGAEQRAAPMPYAVDSDGVCSLEVCFEVPLSAELAEALASDSAQASDVFLVVYSVAPAQSDTSEPHLAEIGAAHLPLRSLLGTPPQHDLTLELLDEAGLVAGALSLCVESAAKALGALIAAARPKMSPAAPPAAGAASDAGLVLSLGELQIWPEASASAARLSPRGRVFIALELVSGPPADACESRSVELSHWRAPFRCCVPLALPHGSAERALLRSSIGASSPADEEDSDLHIILLMEARDGADEIGSAFVNLRALSREPTTADGAPRTLAVVSESGQRIGALSVALRAAACIGAIAAEAAAARGEAVRVIAEEEAAADSSSEAADGDGGLLCTASVSPQDSVRSARDPKVARTLARIRNAPRGQKDAYETPPEALPPIKGARRPAPMLPPPAESVSPRRRICGAEAEPTGDPSCAGLSRGGGVWTSADSGAPLMAPGAPVTPPPRGAVPRDSISASRSSAEDTRDTPLDVGMVRSTGRPSSAEIATRRTYLRQQRDLLHGSDAGGTATPPEPTLAVVVASPKRRVRAGAVDALATELGQTLAWKSKNQAG